jgi:hypothetical protein
MRDELDTVHTFSNVVNVAFGASTGFVTFKTLQAASTAAQVVQHRYSGVRSDRPPRGTFCSFGGFRSDWPQDQQTTAKVFIISNQIELKYQIP